MNSQLASKCFYPKRIFISYGHDEYVTFVNRLKSDLQNRGHKVWFDVDQIKIGVDWEHYIENGLNWVSKDDKGLMILIMTPHSIRRPNGFCLNEISRALIKKIKILPIMLEPCEPPLSLCRIQWLDMTDCFPVDDRKEKYESKFQQLANTLESDQMNLEGNRSRLFNDLNPLAFDAEVRYHLDRFIGRVWVFDEIDRWLADDNASRLFWISGAPGVGKTAISSWLCAHRPEITAFHFCRYDSMQKRDPRRAVMSIAYQLSTQLLDYEAKLARLKLDDLGDLDARSLFDLLIVQPLSANYPIPDKKIIILIDGLDEATANNKNELASLIASELERCPNRLRMIITSRPNPEVIGPLQAYMPFRIDISDQRNENDLRLYLKRELGQITSDIPAGAIDFIVGKSGGMFLYSEWVIAELKKGRMSLDRLNDFPPGLGGIYLKFFERQFPKIEEWESRIRPALEVVAVVQEPINLKILSSIFKWNQHEERKFKESLGSLFSFDREIKPFHKSVMEWLTKEDKTDLYFISEYEGHKILAENGWNLYKANKLTPYLISYLPYHLSRVEWWKELRELLRDTAFFRAAWEKDKYKLLHIWAFLEGNSPLRISEAYDPHIVLTNCQNDKELMALADFLMKTGRNERAEKILEHLVESYRSNNDKHGLSVALYLLGRIYASTGNIKKAISLAEEHERLCRMLNDNANLIKALINRSILFFVKGDYNNAMPILGEIERLSKEYGDIQGQLWAIRFQAFIYSDFHEYDRSLPLLEQEEKIEKEYGYMDYLSICLLSQGEVWRLKGDYNNAMVLYEKSRSICKEIGNNNYLGVCLLNEGLIQQAWGHLDEAMALYKAGEKIGRECGIKENIGLALEGQGQILRLKNQPDDAIILHKEAENIFRSMGRKILLAESLGNQVLALKQKGDLKGAISLLKEQERIYREIGIEKELQECLKQQELIQKDIVF